MKTISRVAFGRNPKGEVVQLQDELLTKVNPALRKEVLDGVLLTTRTVTNTWMLVEHGLGREPLGWIVVSPQRDMRVYRALSGSNNWTTYTAGWGVPSYTVNPGGVVVVSGMALRSAGVAVLDEIMFTGLPRPIGAERLVFPSVDSGGAVSRFDIDGSGQIHWYGSGYAWMTISATYTTDDHATFEFAEDKSASNPDRTRFLRLLSPMVGATFQLWVF
jgi:hypothetical protein